MKRYSGTIENETINQIKGELKEYISELDMVSLMLIKLTKHAVAHDLRNKTHSMQSMHQRIKCMKGYVDSMRSIVMKELSNEN